MAKKIVPQELCMVCSSTPCTCITIDRKKSIRQTPSGDASVVAPEPATAR